MSDQFSIKFNADEIFAGLDEIQKASSEAIRPAAQAGAAVLYEEVRYRVPVGENAHYFYGTHQRYLFPAGTLRDSIYQAYSKDNSVDGKIATYHIAWNHQKAPYGYMVERGTSRAAAHPFIRPAYDAVGNLSLTVARDKYINLMENVPGISK